MARDLATRVAELEEEVRQLLAVIRADEIKLPSEWRLSPLEDRMMRALVKRPAVSYEVAEIVLYDERERHKRANVTNNIAKVVERLKVKINPLGFAIHTERLRGYYMTEADRAKAKRMIETREEPVGYFAPGMMAPSIRISR